jgi:quercetin dioxygenase-like cupin family protein
VKDNENAMSSQQTNPRLPVEPAPGHGESEFAPLLTEPFARAWTPPVAQLAGVTALRGRLLGRVSASRSAEAAMHTMRRRSLPRETLGEGVSAQTLYESHPGQAMRPGEPLRARLLELAPGARLLPAMLAEPALFEARHREWLVLSGSARCGEEFLSQRDYHLDPAGHASPIWTSVDGALLFLRESSALPVSAADGAFTVRDAEAGWPDFAPGIQRRVLWQHEGEASMLYFVQPGVQVAHHGHEHDEECLMLQGELFLDDVLLQPGDYQLAPTGTDHRITETDTGVVLYAHGDLDLKFVA